MNLICMGGNVALMLLSLSLTTSAESIEIHFIPVPVILECSAVHGFIIEPQINACYGQKSKCSFHQLLIYA